MNNGCVIAHPDTAREKATELRKSGRSFGEIAKILHISKSTASLWLSSTPISKKALNIIERKRKEARIKGLAVIKSHRVEKNNQINNQALLTVKSFDLNNPQLCKILCSFLYWGEGSKTGYRTAFTNSDPVMITTYLSLLRKSFKIDENKLRALVHVHEYHNDSEIKQYWSRLTAIPLSRFTKSYLKPHTKKIIRPGYKGTLRISYYDVMIVNELRAIYNTLAEHI